MYICTYTCIYICTYVYPYTVISRFTPLSLALSIHTRKHTISSRHVC